MEYAQLSETKSDSRKREKPKKSAKRLVLFFVLLMLVFGLYNFLPAILKIAKLFIQAPSEVFTVVANRGPDLKNDNGRVNMLILGTGGGDHDGPDLTDTIILASIDQTSGNTVLFSIPRDVYIDDYQAKINAVYAESKPKEQRLAKTMDTYSKYFGLPIHYGLRLDFNGFKKSVDLVGGLDIPVANTFDDYEYPIENKEHDSCGFVEQYEDATGAVIAPSPSLPKASSKSATVLPSLTPKAGKRLVFFNPTTNIKIYEEEVTVLNNPYSCRFEHIHFDKGTTHMDGTTALKFVRSRKGNNGEGSDFARSRRQQTVILAFRQAMLSKETLFDIGKIGELINTFGESVDTTVQSDSYGDFYQLYRRIKSAQIKTVALTDEGDLGEPVFHHPTVGDYGGQWVLVPKDNNWQVVKDTITKSLLLPSPTPSSSAASSP